MYLYPISPLMAGLLLNNRGAWVVAGILVIQIMLFALIDDSLPAYADNSDSLSETLLRSYWLISATLLTAVFVNFYERLNSRFRKEMSELAFKDVLTGIPNRRSLMEALEVSIAYCRANDSWLTLMMIDVDQFKNVNDSYSHAIGDQCLQWIAHRLQSSLRSNSDLVARIGGDEFVAMLPDVDDTQAERISRLIMDNIASRNDMEDKPLPALSVSIGHASARGKSLPSAKELLNQADAAMYRAKGRKLS
jgi:diguanylate cyclase (GGDEF)-like protein